MVHIKNINPSPASTRIPSRVLHLILYFLALQKPGITSSIPPGKKAYRTRYQKPKNQQTPLNLQGIALCLLKTQFAKKPKNPV